MSFLQRALLDAYCVTHEVQYRKVMECNFVHMTVVAAQAGLLMMCVLDAQAWSAGPLASSRAAAERDLRRSTP